MERSGWDSLRIKPSDCLRASVDVVRSIGASILDRVSGGGFVMDVVRHLPESGYSSSHKVSGAAEMLDNYLEDPDKLGYIYDIETEGFVYTGEPEEQGDGLS